MANRISTIKARLLTVALMAMAPIALAIAFTLWELAPQLDRLAQDDALAQGFASAATLVVAMTVSLVIAWMGVRHLVLTKLEALNAAAARIHAGETNVRSGLTGEDCEFGVLARTFDAMASAVDQRALDFRNSLTESEARFQVALKHSAIMVFAQDLELRYSWMFNGPAGTETMVGQRDCDVWSPEDAERLVGIKHDVLAGGRGRREDVALTIGATRRIFDAWHDPLLDEHGAVIGIVGAALDVTESRTLQAALMAAREDAERANEAKSRFLAAASHDLRQPFQAMRLFRAALEPFLTAPRAISIAAKLDEAMTAGEQLLKTLLDISTLEAGIVSPKPMVVSTAEVISRLAREFLPQAASHGLDLKIHALDTQVVTDPVLLERMLRNLLHNAVRYTETGGILLGARRRGDCVMFQVWDTGIGIAPEQQNMVFEDFYQVGNLGRDRACGLGLGLAVVARTARLLDHEVRLHSRPGRGSVFSVSVPLALDHCEI